jgi:hypothetical protein
MVNQYRRAAFPVHAGIGKAAFLYSKKYPDNTSIKYQKCLKNNKSFVFLRLKRNLH